jgi:hypothetical protein
MFALNTLGSFCARKVVVNPLSGTAQVQFRGSEVTYQFKKVSRRALAKAVAVDLLAGGQPSLGEWVNKTLLA